MAVAAERTAGEPWAWASRAAWEPASSRPPARWCLLVPCACPTWTRSRRPRPRRTAAWRLGRLRLQRGAGRGARRQLAIGLGSVRRPSAAGLQRREHRHQNDGEQDSASHRGLLFSGTMGQHDRRREGAGRSVARGPISAPDEPPRRAARPELLGPVAVRRERSRVQRRHPPGPLQLRGQLADHRLRPVDRHRSSPSSRGAHLPASTPVQFVRSNASAVGPAGQGAPYRVGGVRLVAARWSWSRAWRNW
jgi:hypothetical protein